VPDNVAAGELADDLRPSIRAFLASRPETSRGEFTLPMLTGVLRVRWNLQL